MIVPKSRRMGRASRRRLKRPLSATLNNLSCDPSVVALVQWMCSQGWEATTRLRLASCKLTGRGLQAVKGVKIGDVLVSIPERLLITLNTVMKYFQIENLSVSVSEHTLLSVFVMLHNSLGSDSVWFPYCRTLPQTFSTPAFCHEREINHLPLFIRQPAIDQKIAIEKSFSEALEFWKLLISSGRILSSVPSFVDFRYAWFVVNTRAVSMLSQIGLETAKISNMGSMALAPYLDMFNHSHEAQVDAGFNYSRRTYEIRTLCPYSSKNQVFISYGTHDNLKLFIEYGFYLPNNPHDVIKFDLTEILRFVGMIRNTSSLKGPKMEFLLAHGLLKDLSCNREGLSWNLNALIYVLCLDEFNKYLWSRVFHGDWLSLESLLERRAALQIVKCKKLEFIESQRNMEKLVSCSDSFQIAKELLREYTKILCDAEVKYKALCQNVVEVT